MNSSPQQLLTEALQLPTVDRGQLAARLIASLESEADPEVDQAWSDEIARRLQDIDEGRVPMIPWSEVRRQLRGQDDAAG